LARTNSGVKKPESTLPNAFDRVKTLETKRGRVLSEIIGFVQAPICEQDFRSLHLRVGDRGVWLKPGKYIPNGHDGDTLENLLIKIRQQFPGKSFQGLELLWDGQALPVKRIPVWIWVPRDIANQRFCPGKQAE
jgi:hypothetical protein